MDQIRGAVYWALSGVQYLNADEVQKHVHQEMARYLAATGRNPARVSNTMLRQLIRRDALWRENGSSGQVALFSHEEAPPTRDQG